MINDYYLTCFLQFVYLVLDPDDLVMCSYSLSHVLSSSYTLKQYDL